MPHPEMNLDPSDHCIFAGHELLYDVGKFAIVVGGYYVLSKVVDGIGERQKLLTKSQKKA